MKSKESKESKNSKKDEIKPDSVIAYAVTGRPDQVIITGADKKRARNGLIITADKAIHDKDGNIDITDDNIKSEVPVSTPAIDLYFELTDEAHGKPNAMLRKLGKKADKVVQELVDNGLAFYGKDQSGRKTVEVDVFDIPQ